MVVVGVMVVVMVVVVVVGVMVVVVVVGPRGGGFGGGCLWRNYWCTCELYTPSSVVLGVDTYKGTKYSGVTPLRLMASSVFLITFLVTNDIELERLDGDGNGSLCAM